jgi:hypothetical protein
VGRIPRWLILLPAVVLSFFPFVARADAVQGLDASYYVVDEIPPQQSTSLYTLCASEVENNINRSYDGEPVEGCPDDLFMVHLTGFILIPEHESIEFMLASDDGGEITIGGNTFGVWYDQGCTWTMSGNLSLQAASVPLELFAYENGGGACLMLAWKIDDGQWEIVPDEAFTTSPTVSTTTSEVSTTTVAESTTTQASTTSSVPQTTSTESTTTTLEPSTTQASTTTTSTTTTSTVPATTTTTEPPSPPPAQPPATVEPPPTTMPAPPDTEPTPPETQPTPPETAPQPPETNPTFPPAATLPLVEVTSPPDAPQAPETFPIPDTAPPPPDTAPAPPDVKEALTVEQFDAVIEQLSEATEEQIVALVDDLITKDLDTSQAAAFVSSPEVLAAITSVQAEALFDEISTDELSVEQAAEVVAAVQDAPAEVREAFESVLNIFSGFADSYVPVDSRIPVSERRALVALGAVLLAASPAPTLRRRQ